MLEKKVNKEGQEQIIDNFDQIIKIGNRFLQVRLIKTKKFRDRFKVNGEFTEPMPRAKFINPSDDFCYIIKRKDLLALKKEVKNEKSI